MLEELIVNIVEKQDTLWIKRLRFFKRFSISSCDLYLHSEFFSSFKFNLLIL